ncbi:hypothetical protein BA92_02195 [Sanguibacteroides justesenii]|uniref:Glycosyl transferase family 1 domain-containing protein n=2 Tax=Sanguibacteroides justesenii TaxID=1547597 RepID=A0A0C3R8F6_9PORP|nr:hypothetical protein BA92_02195 [Sanguibacteroides justesenii]
MYAFAKSILWKGLEQDADVYQLHSPIFLLFACRLKKMGKKVIFDSHEFYGLQIREKKYLPELFRKIVAVVYMKYEAYVCRRIDAVIQVCTVEGKDYFQNRCRRSVFLSNVPELSVFESDGGTTFAKRNSVIHVGGLTHDRGITDLVKAAALTKVRVELAGVFLPEGYQDQLKETGGYSNVKYWGFVNKNDLPEILDHCLAGISTLLNVGQYSRIDTLPTKVYEYMAMRLPVVLSNTPYNKRLNDLGKFGICVAPDNPQEIADAINYLKEHPDKAKKMGINGRRLVEERFNWETEKLKLLDLYKML